MPVDKNARLRHKILDSIFSSGSEYNTIDNIIDTVNERLAIYGAPQVSLRTIRTDISVMRSEEYDAPIVYHPSGKYYSYSERGYSIFKGKMSKEDLNVLRSTIEMLGKYRAGNIWLEELLTSLECRLGITPKRNKVVLFDDNRGLKGIEFLNPVIQHTINNQVMEYTYRSFRGHEETYTIHPYFVKQFNGRWFVYGWDSKYGRYMNVALDRTVSIRLSETPFNEDKRVDGDEYLKDVIGVTVPYEGTQLMNLRLKFTPERFPYITSKPIHHSQKVIDAENYIIEISVKRNRELDQKIFSFMPDVEVLSPLHYRQEVAEMIERNLKKYK